MGLLCRDAPQNFELLGLEAIDHQVTVSTVQHRFDDPYKIGSEIQKFKCLINKLVIDTIEGFGKVNQ